MQMASLVLTADMHNRTVRLSEQVEECKVSIASQYGAIQAGLTRYVG